MYTKQALRELGISGQLTDAQRESLDNNGFFVVEDVLSAAACRAMADEFDRLHEREGEQGGHEVHVEPSARRVSNIFNKTAAFDPCLEIEPLLLASHYLLGEFKLHGANLREPLPGGGHQNLHADVPKKFDDDWWVSNAIVAFDDITADNGPPRVVPGSHHWQPVNVAYVNIHDWQPAPLTPEQQARVPDDLGAPYPGELRVSCPAGSVIVINSSLWHAGTTNNNGTRRRVLHLTYTRRDLPQQLVQRAHLTPELYQRMSPAQRFLLDIEELPEGTALAPALQAAGRGAGSDWWKPETVTG
jgi:ectoine hydroxylase-related dioxygenase (phytanoyl-CoA dioxygenase family)